MRKLALREARHPRIVIAIAVALLIPSIIGFFCTRVNYDMMSYLPDTFESVQGEQVLDEVFNNAGISIIVFDNYDPKYVDAVRTEIEKIEGVTSATWISTVADISIPQDIMPEAVTDIFYSKDGTSTMMLVQYKYKGSSNETLATIKNIKKLLDKKCPVPLMITKNDRTLGVDNGDVGVVMPDDPKTLHLPGGRKIRLELLPDTELAFASTVHKAQGSEFDDVAIVLPPNTGKPEERKEESDSFKLLTREILYTAITRTKKTVAIWGSEDAIRHCAQHAIERVSGLAARNDS